MDRLNNRAYYANRSIFKKLTPKSAWLLGVFVGDGNMKSYSDNGYRITFTNKDKDFILTIKNVLDSKHNLRYDNGTYKLRIGGKEMYNDLLNLGYSERKSNFIHITPKLPKKCLRDFIRGYFDSDGCVYINKPVYRKRKRKYNYLRVVFSSKSKTIIKQLWEHFELISIKSTYSSSLKDTNFKKNVKMWSLQMGQASSIMFYNLIYYPGCVYYKGKKDNFEKYKEECLKKYVGGIK